MKKISFLRIVSISFSSRKIFIPILLTVTVLFPRTFEAQSKENQILKIYVHNFKLESGISKSLENRFRNGIINSILKNYEGRFNIADDDSLAALLKQAELQQKQNCSDEICMKQIADAIDADELISGSIFSTPKGYKINLRSQRRDPKTLTYTIKTAFDLEFPDYQIDYYSSEAGRKLMDPRYQVNFAAAFPGAVSKVEFPSLQIQVGKADEINVLNFSSEDPGTKNFLEAIAPRLSKADRLTKEKSYEESVSEYSETLITLENRLSEKTKKEMSDYLNGIRSKISNSYLLLYKDRISLLDSKASSGGEISSLRNLSEEYGKIYSDYKSKTPEAFRLKELENVLETRIEKMNLVVLGLREKVADKEYSEFDFSGAVQNYRGIRGELNKLPYSSEYSSFRARIDRKILTSETTGRSYLQSKLSGIYQVLEKAFVSEGFESEAERKNNYLIKIKEGFRSALEILARSEFVSEEQIKYFNQYRNKMSSQLGQNLFDQEKADSLLHEGIDRNFRNQVDSSLKLGANPNAESPDSGKTGAKRLSESKIILISPDALKILRNSIKTDSSLDSAFFESIRQRNLDDTVRFILRGSDPNTKDYLDNTPLHKAAGYGSYEMSVFLLQIGAGINSKNGEGETPLHRAVSNGFYELCALLLRNGADPNATRNDGMTPLHLAVPSPDLTRLLLERGADVNMKNDEGWTPLHKGAESGAAESLKLLIRAGAKVNEKDNIGWTPMDWAVQKNRYEKPNIVKILKTAGAECQVNCVE
ncbi:hypothetical protein CH371_00990 [Leptospira wolffii]|uniref:Uncharacterized protein n=1 Tax=Leptospira wolffii TaxID=409998 RepID=A0A2M9ZE64_9LEPT|nr:ankyrin repeat domain-containing protein [Leptospira wolffii]PJZ66715.1 hypothetical protein CH371_00990 [Leptospira wolffii]